jgi:hypothetical protein
LGGDDKGAGGRRASIVKFASVLIGRKGSVVSVEEGEVIEIEKEETA